MSMTTTLQKYLADNGVSYDILPHSATSSSLSAAHSTHVHGHMVAKPVILEDEAGYLMAVVPATEHVKMGKLNRILDRDMTLAREDELRELFTDCDLGAIPPMGSAYGMQSIIDGIIQFFDRYMPEPFAFGIVMTLVVMLVTWTATDTGPVQVVVAWGDHQLSVWVVLVAAARAVESSG